ncbi:MAG: PAS domain-containing protein, partial [Deltaproteobacteria bacterium]|nr:PAS domain-containing protein [Deltaproteobacteria bacterium]
MKNKKIISARSFLSEASPERFEAVIRSISDGVFTVDKEWRITCFNRAAEEITGVPRSKAMGRKCYDVFRSNICRDACAMQYTIETGNPIVNLAVSITDSKGNQIPVSVATALFRDARGEL